MIFCALSSFLKLQSRQYWIYLSFKKPSGNQDFYIFTESVWGNELLSSKFRVMNWSTWNCKPFFLMNFAKLQIFKFTLEKVKTTFSSLQAIQWRAVRLWLDVGVYIQTSCRKLYKKLYIMMDGPNWSKTKIQNMTARSYYQLYGLEFCEFQELLPAKSAAWDWEYLPDRRQLAKFCHISSSQSAFILSVYWRLDIQVCTDLPITILSRDQLEIMNFNVLSFYLFNYMEVTEYNTESSCTVYPAYHGARARPWTCRRSGWGPSWEEPASPSSSPWPAAGRTSSWWRAAGWRAEDTPGRSPAPGGRQ